MIPISRLNPNLIKRVNIIHPNWRKPGGNPLDPNDYLHASEFLRKEEITQLFADWGIELRWYYWDDFMQLDPTQIPVELITCCLSSPWTPPWMDIGFQTFLAISPAHELIELEDEYWGEQGFKPREIEPGKFWRPDWEWIIQHPTIQVFSDMIKQCHENNLKALSKTNNEPTAGNE